MLVSVLVLMEKKNMTGRHSGVLTHVQAVGYTAASTERLLLPRECLTARKTFWTLQSKWLTLLKQGPWTLVYFLHYTIVMLLRHTEEVHWLSRGKVLTHFCNWETSLKFSLPTIIFTCLTACTMTSFSHDWPIWVSFFLAWMIWI